MTAFLAGVLWMRTESRTDLTLTDRAVLSVLFSFADDGDDPRAFASASRLATRAGCSRRTVQRALERLEDRGVIVGQHRHKAPTIWRLSDVLKRESGDSVSSGGDSVTQAWRQDDAHLASESPTPGDRMTRQFTEVSSGRKSRNSTDVNAADARRSRGADAPARHSLTPRYAGLPAGVCPVAKED
ncbi:helix-turn-helix domain-containing protein [Nocardioides sp. HB32]